MDQSFTIIGVPDGKFVWRTSLTGIGQCASYFSVNLQT